MRRGARIHIEPGWPNGVSVMLSERAPPDLVLLVGGEAVLTVVAAGGQFVPCEDGIRWVRDYWLTHSAHGRVYCVSEAHLRRIGEREAQGQQLLYMEQLREQVAIYGPAIREALRDA